jgi:phosphoribosyl 1,2-cyclic phosphodiesterase
MEVKKAINFKIQKIVGAIVSHEHGDHSKYIKDVLKARIPVYASMGTIHNTEIINRQTKLYPIQLKAGERQKIGNFMVLPFDVKHDCAEPIGFLIRHEQTGNVLFATDTYYLPYCFANLNNILIECNYRRDILMRNIEGGKIPPSHYNRLLESHMSFETCREALIANDLKQVNNIVLIHLSDGNSNADEFMRDIHKATGKNVHIADKGMRIQFNKTPF